MEWASGNIFIRPNPLSAGQGVQGHAHNFDHTTFFLRGWWLVRGITPDGRTIIQQFCAPEYAETRRLLALVEPDKVTRPVRLADTVDADGRPCFTFTFIGKDDPVPDGGEEIVFAATMHHALIKAEVLHELVCLSDAGEFDCVYSHREPQGDIVQEVTGWYEAYQ